MALVSVGLGKQMNKVALATQDVPLPDFSTRAFSSIGVLGVRDQATQSEQRITGSAVWL